MTHKLKHSNNTMNTTVDEELVVGIFHHPDLKNLTCTKGLIKTDNSKKC